MNRLPHTEYEPTDPAHVATGVWLSIDDGGTTVQRLGIIVPNDPMVRQLGIDALTVIHYDGLQQPTNDEEVLHNYHSRKLMFTLLDGFEWGGTTKHKIEGPLAVQPPAVAPTDTPPDDLHEQYEQSQYDYRSFLSKYGAKYGKTFPPGGIVRPQTNGEYQTPVHRPAPGYLKQAVVVDEKGVRVLPLVLVPKGYVEVDLYSVFSKDDWNDDPAPVEDTQKGLSPISMTKDEVVAMDFLLAGKRFARYAQQNEEAPPQFIGQTDAPVMGIDPAHPDGDEGAYLLVRIRDGQVEYTNAPDEMKQVIDFNLKLSTPSSDTTSPDASQ